MLTTEILKKAKQIALLIEALPQQNLFGDRRFFYKAYLLVAEAYSLLSSELTAKPVLFRLPLRGDPVQVVHWVKE